MCLLVVLASQQHLSSLFFITLYNNMLDRCVIICFTTIQAMIISSLCQTSLITTNQEIMTIPIYAFVGK